MRLSEPEIDTVYAAARPLPAERREAFFQHINQSLQGRAEPGPGHVDRAIRSAQQKYLTYPDLSKTNGYVQPGGRRVAK